MRQPVRFKTTYIALATIVGILTLFSMSCKKTKTLTVGGTLQFSTDTLHFDTVFTAAGSITRGVLIYNPQNEAVVLSSVRLLNGNNSYFHLNVDGYSGNNIPNLKIAPHDSIYVFATVNIDPNDTLTPFLVTDSLIATLNGQQYYLPFTAYGQNAHYIVSDSITATTTWLTDKPYVVIHTCVVGGPTGTALNIPRGCRVYMHQDARFVVYQTLNIGMTPTASQDSALFQGDRLDRVYFGYIGYPGEWCGLWYVPGSTGNISHTVLKNCGGNAAYYNYFTQPAAIRVDTAATLTMDRTVVKNSIGFGILSWQGTVIATNCLVNTTGAEALAIIQGGYDSITNCTFANYGGTAVTHSTNGTAAILNYFNNGDGTWNPGALNGVMRNCIVYGSLDSEIVCDSLGGASANFRMDHCLLKMGNVREHFVQFSSCKFNQDPMFKDQQNGDFHILTGSPAIGAGNPSFTPTYDIEGSNRTVRDIGCYKGP
jgi:hypothetical protein